MTTDLPRVGDTITTAAEWEVQITVLRNGEEIKTSDALGDDPASALYFAHNDLELWAQEVAR